jgi:hypothetical protein
MHRDRAGVKGAAARLGAKSGGIVIPPVFFWRFEDVARGIEANPA